ncbi:unnamed protein product [Blepharisma stoltei]|uniref:SPIN90/Ldb17 leucine-rich domain-containing protein n=1 Tax=Blepharisma stoltei TaxID=1481888 RepID=A0AAU9JZ28_9CILI|nr:unnamed protein product [Blepharisma stoltei]
MSAQEIEELRRSLEILDENSIEGVKQKAEELIVVLITSFLESLEMKEVADYFLHILRQLILHVKDNVLPKMKEDPDFSNGLYRYLLESKSLSGDALGCLGEIFSLELINDCQSIEEITNKLLDSLETSEESQYNSIIDLLVVIATESPLNFLNQCSSHRNSRYFGEELLQLLNRSTESLMVKYLNCIQGLIEHQVSFFYSNDLKILCDIIIQGLENTSDLSLRKKLLDTYDALEINEDFLSLNHRVEEAKEIADLARQSLGEAEKVKRQSIIETLING